MEEVYKIKVEEIIGKMKCSKDYKCYKSGFEDLCKAEDIGLKTILKCLEENPRECEFSIMLGDGFFCKCPLRIHIIKELKK